MVIVVEIPEKHKKLAEAMKELVAQVVAEDGGDERGKAVDYGVVERRISDATAKVEREAHGALLSMLDIDRPSVMVGDKRCSRAGRARGTYNTLAGPVEVERTLYRSPEGRGTVDAISLRIGAVHDGWLPQTAKAVAFSVQQATSREAARLHEQAGRLPYSRSSFERVAHEVGAHVVARHEDVEDALIAGYEVPQKAASISVSLDRVSVPMEEPRARPVGRPRKGAPKNPISREFRMAYCGTVTLHDADGEALHTIRYGTMPNADIDALVEGLFGDTFTLRRKRPDLKVILLCDGAPEMWNLLAQAFSEERLGCSFSRLLDLHHLTEKLGKAARLISNEPSALVDRWKLRLLNDTKAHEKILRDLKDSGLEHARHGDAQPVHDAITYLTNHADKLDYASARTAGLPIGSGNVEATCKSLFEVRFKRSGSRWKEDSGEHVVHLRALALSDRWDQAIVLTLAPLRRPVRPAPPRRWAA